MSVVPARVLATVTAAQILNVAATTIIVVALPAVGADLGADATEQQWIVDAFVLVFASLLVAGGVLGDRYGRRTAFLCGLAAFAVGSLLCALAPTVEWLLAGRVLQALGPPLVLPASLAIVTATYPDPVARARAVGFWAMGSGTGLAIGPPLGGVLVDGLGWRWIFLVNVPLALVLVLAGLRGVPRDRPPRPEHPFDAAAAALLIVGVALLVFALIEGRELGWGSPVVLGAVAVVVLLGVLFVRQERRHPDPLVDLALVRRPSFVAANLGGATMYGALMGSAVYVSIFLQEVQDRSALEAGLCLLPQGALTALCGPFSGRLAGRIGPRVPIVLGMLIAAGAFAALLGLEAATPLWQVWLLFGVLGAAIGISLPAMTVTALSAAPVEEAGMASALHNASRQLGQTFGVAILGSILFAVAGEEADSGTLGDAAAGGYIDGLHAALLATSVGLAATAAVIAVLLRTAGSGGSPRPSPASPRP